MGKPRESSATDADIVASYQETLSAYKTGKLLGVGISTVYRALMAAGIAANGLRHYQKSKERYPTEVQMEIRRLYEAGAYAPELRAKFGGSTSSIISAIVRAGGKMRPSPGAISKITEEDKEQACKMYREGIPYGIIAAHLKLSSYVIRDVLTANGIKIRFRGRGRGNHKLGRKVGSQGYVYVPIADDDPMAAMRDQKGYVSEHRVTLARKLGRCLLDSETVHHINGDRGDNRPENLQLRQGRHGKGVVMRCRTCGSLDVHPVEMDDES